MSIVDLMDKHTAAWARHRQFFMDFRSRYLGRKRWEEVCNDPYQGVKVREAIKCRIMSASAELLNTIFE